MFSGIVGILRLIAVFSVIFLGLLGVLTILDLIPRENFQEWSVKILLTAGLLAVVSLIVMALAKKGSDQP